MITNARTTILKERIDFSKVLMLSEDDFSRYLSSCIYVIKVCQSYTGRCVLPIQLCFHTQGVLLELSVLFGCLQVYTNT